MGLLKGLAKKAAIGIGAAIAAGAVAGVAAAKVAKKRKAAKATNNGELDDDDIDEEELEEEEDIEEDEDIDEEEIEEEEDIEEDDESEDEEDEDIEEVKPKKIKVKKPRPQKECSFKISSDKIILKCSRDNIVFEINERKHKKNYIGYLDDSPVVRIDVGYEYVSVNKHFPTKRRNDERIIHVDGMLLGTLRKDSSYDEDIDSDTPKWQCCLDKWTINFDINNKEIHITKGKKDFFVKSSETEGFVFKYFAKDLYESILYAALILATIDSLRIDEWHYSYSDTLYSPF